jgi:hypothetical protein
MTYLLLFVFALPTLLLLCAVLLFTWSAFTPRVQLHLTDVISEIDSVDLSDLQELVSPLLDSYLQAGTPQKLSAELSQAQRTRMKLTGRHFDRMLHNTVLYQSLARGAFDRLQNVHPLRAPETTVLLSEILDLATTIRVYLFAAKWKIFILGSFGLYSQFGALQGKQLLDLYCSLQELVLELAKMHDYRAYQNLLSAI